MQELMDAQRASEELSLGRGREQFERRLTAAQRGNAGAAFGAAKRLLSGGTTSVSEAIEQWIEDRSGGGRPHAALEWIKRAGPDQAAYLTMLAVLNHIYGRSRATVVAREISDRIQLESRARALKEQAPGLFNYKIPKLQRATSLRHVKFALSQTIDYAKVVTPKMTEHQRIQVGMTLLDICREATDLFHLQTLPVRKGKQMQKETYIWPTEETQEWIEKRNEILAAASVKYRPLVVPPLDWDLGERGGYLYGLKGSTPLVTTWDQRHSDEVENTSMPLVYDALNAMQRTPWSINRRILGVVEQLTRAGGGYYDSTTSTLMSRGSVPMLTPIDMPPKPHDMDTNEEANRLWRREASKRKEINNIERASRVRDFWSIFAIAREYTTVVPFFFTWTTDFRGRMYPVTGEGLSPQGSDLSRGLLQFATSKPIENKEQIEALMLHGASCLDEWGGTKVGTLTRQERIDLIESLAINIRHATLDPLGKYNWWMEADKPLMFLAFCFDFVGYMDEGFGYRSRLPVHVDGSCNGVQHMAALMRDEATALEVNVVPNDRPNDLYATMAEYAVESLSAIAVKDTDATVRKLAGLWLESGLVNRKACKRPTMTFGYGGTQYGFSDQLQAHFRDNGDTGKLVKLFHIKPEERTHYPMAIRLLARVIFAGLRDVVPGAFAVREWLQGAATEATAKGASLIHWKVPVTRFPVYQRYNLSRAMQVDTTLSGGVHKRRSQNTIRLVLPGTDARKHRNGIAPNFIHSLDAAHLVLTTACMDGVPMNAVHDSFGCHAAEVPKLERSLRATFLELYANDVAGDLQRQLGVETIPPMVNTLDLEGVLKADYFFV